MRYLKEPEFRHDSARKIGVLLVNLGTPEAPTPAAVKRYLAEFLSDRRVVEIPRLPWWLILHGIILNTRPKKSAAKYAAIWSNEGSPLRVWTEKQAKLLKGWLGENVAEPLLVEMAMRYGSPSIESAINKLKAAGCDRLLLVPLYPQYAASTTASVVDAMGKVMAKIRNQPALRIVKSFHDDPGYLSALAASVREHWYRNGRGDHLLMSFHGAPRYTLERGDPYFCHCQKTARLLAEVLQLDKTEYSVSFQSRFGRAKWFEPSTENMLNSIGKRKTAKLDVICPGFVADCLETLEEIALEGKQTFLAAGGGEYRYIPALNDRPDWIAALGHRVCLEMNGWLADSFNPSTQKNMVNQTLTYALKIGAKK
ncbi:MAG: ferrochelatase [Formivibrio sp.]|nr:ferrochelatase [Formivibrio sp.]